MIIVNTGNPLKSSILWKDRYRHGRIRVRKYLVSILNCNIIEETKKLSIYLPQATNMMLDLGCGVGDVSIKAIESQKVTTVIGCEMSLFNCGLYVKNVAQYDGVYGCLGFGEKLPFRDNMFDAVFLADVIEHVY